jgi:hypothetical protein
MVDRWWWSTKPATIGTLPVAVDRQTAFAAG